LTTIGLLLNTHNEIGNRASGFREAVRSFEEFLVVDTGSTDDTVAVARNLGATVIHHTGATTSARHGTPGTCSSGFDRRHPRSSS